MDDLSDLIVGRIFATLRDRDRERQETSQSRMSGSDVDTRERADGRGGINSKRESSLFKQRNQKRRKQAILMGKDSAASCPSTSLSKPSTLFRIEALIDRVKRGRPPNSEPYIHNGETVLRLQRENKKGQEKVLELEREVKELRRRLGRSAVVSKELAVAVE